MLKKRLTTVLKMKYEAKKFLQILVVFTIFIFLFCYLLLDSERCYVDNYFDVVNFRNQNLSIKCNFITLSYSKYMGTGNLMFLYASLYGIAKKNNKIAFLPEEFPLLKIFDLTVPVTSTIPLDTFKNVGEKYCCIYEPESTDIACDTNITLGGYRESWKYFHKYSREIKRQFTFIKSVKDECERVMEMLLSVINSEQQRNRTIFIGVHMRRGDFVDNKSGYVQGDENYFQRAIEFYDRMFSEDYYSKVFVVLGNDYKWNKFTLNNSPNILVIRPRSPAVDLCVLSKCNHSIISSGTYSWWSAYLAGGHTTYMKDQCRPNSTLCKLFKMDDYINPKWNWTAL